MGIRENHEFGHIKSPEICGVGKLIQKSFGELQGMSNLAGWEGKE